MHTPHRVVVVLHDEDDVEAAEQRRRQPRVVVVQAPGNQVQVESKLLFVRLNL